VLIADAMNLGIDLICLEDGVEERPRLLLDISANSLSLVSGLQIISSFMSFMTLSLTHCVCSGH
jgi:hypothetical protein